MRVKANALWIVFSLFAVTVLFTHEGEPYFVSEGPYATGKIIVWLTFLSFLSYSIYCSRKENIVKTIKLMWPYHWARQVGLDLYLGMSLMAFVIYLNEASLWVLGFWLLPLILFVNLTTLLYVALNYDSLVSNFM